MTKKQYVYFKHRCSNQPEVYSRKDPKGECKYRHKSSLDCDSS